MPKTIVVCGATGGLGGSVARHMLAEGWKVRAITRNKDSTGAKALLEAGAELASADYDDVASLETAFKVIQSLYRQTELASLTWVCLGRQRHLRRDQFLRIHARTRRYGSSEEGNAAVGQHCYCGEQNPVARAFDLAYAAFGGEVGRGRVLCSSFGRE
jgi:NAD(P)-dependent dehydrogenase (short-subunit alcohol dehydrogenase family)